MTMWRYHDFLPVEADRALDMGTGFTPLIHAKNLGRRLGLENLYIKNDSVNPTYSFKDRVVSVAAGKALEFEFDTLACASTGNLMGSVAAHGAKAGVPTMVFFPSNLEKGKVLGAGIYGAIAAQITSVDAVYMIIGLYAAAAVCLTFFNVKAHATRIEALNSETLRTQNA